MNDKIKAFGDLHVPGDPLILFNIWDAGSAAAVAKGGAKALATGSYGVAKSHGFEDGETFPPELVLANLAQIVRVTDLPVTLDFEAGYGADPAAVGVSVANAAAVGAVGINIEDKDPATRQMFATEDAAARVKAAAASGIWINVRCDLFVVAPKAEQDATLIDAVVERANAYAGAGADSLFVPLLGDEGLIARLCENSPLPVNILINPGVPDHRTLAGLGVARISHGHGPWARTMQLLEEEARVATTALS